MNLRSVTSCRLLALALGGLSAVSSQAFVFQFGEVKGSFDTTLSVGGLYRLGDPDPELYGITNTAGGVAGRQRSVNADDGNLNYRKGMASALVKAATTCSSTTKAPASSSAAITSTTSSTPTAPARKWP